MSNEYAPPTPKGRDGIPKVFYYPAKIALASQNKENASVSSILLLTHDTTEIEVAAAGQNVAGKWLTQANIDNSVAGTSVISAAGTANFDFTIGNNTVRRFVVPIATVNQNQSSIQGVNRLEGLYPAVAFKTFAGTGSVLTMEF